MTGIKAKPDFQMSIPAGQINRKTNGRHWKKACVNSKLNR